jgi:hypothetical protein
MATNHRDSWNRAAQQVLEDTYNAAHEDEDLQPVNQRYIKIGDRVEQVNTVTVFEFTISDVDDPELYAADPLWKWQHSEQGQWVMKNALETPKWYPMQEPMTYGWRYIVTAKLTGPKLTEWLLRHG